MAVVPSPVPGEVVPPSNRAPISKSVASNYKKDVRTGRSRDNSKIPDDVIARKRQDLRRYAATLKPNSNVAKEYEQFLNEQNLVQSTRTHVEDTIGAATTMTMNHVSTESDRMCGQTTAVVKSEVGKAMSLSFLKLGSSSASAAPAMGGRPRQRHHRHQPRPPLPTMQAPRPPLPTMQVQRRWMTL